ncbi:MAG: DUF3524 domain-containing protein [Pseudomonadota bacterium]
MRILVLEPYYGGSHQSFLAGLAAHLPFVFDIRCLPARNWKWRMRFSAPYFAGILPKTREHDVVLCSTFVDVAVLRGLGPSWLHEAPILTYYHENQFVYPVQVDDKRDMHFAVTNMLTAAASNKTAFNSFYNMDTFMAGCEDICRKIPDMKIDITASIRAKAEVLYPPVDFRDLDDALSLPPLHGKVPVIVWNHRWEHDKNPELFFETLFCLQEQQVDFNVVLLGQSFEHQPEIFANAVAKLGNRILHVGFVQDKKEYCRWLANGDIVVSTARHEFYGIAVIEAVRAGCRPLLPDRLSYPELFPKEFLYEEKDFLYRLKEALHLERIGRSRGNELTGKYSWNQLSGRYKEWFSI